MSKIETRDFYVRSRSIVGELEAKYPARATIGEKMWMWSTAENLPAGSIWVEIGTYRGWSAKIVADANPNILVITIDPENTNRANALAKVWRGATNIVPITAMSVCGADGNDTIRAVVDYIAHRDADVVYIDGDHSVEGVTADIEHYEEIVKTGGILSGHDYNWIRKRMRRRSSRTTTAVTSWFEKNDRTIHNTERIWWAVM